MVSIHVPPSAGTAVADAAVDPASVSAAPSTAVSGAAVSGTAVPGAAQVAPCEPAAPGGPHEVRHTSWLRARLNRLTASNEEVHAAAEQTHAVRLGGTPIEQLPLRRSATVCGILRSVTLRPRAGVPALEAELYDGSGVLSLVWLGRRHIAGIEPGRRMRVTGMVTGEHGERTVFNPRYDLLPPRG